MIRILRENNFNLINTKPDILKYNYFFAILNNWDRYNLLQKENILYQLSKKDYINTLIKATKNK